MLVKIFIVNFLLQILSGCGTTNELNEGNIDCECNVPEVQNQIIANLYSHIISEIGGDTEYKFDVAEIKKITEPKLKEHIKNIKNKVKDDQNLHCYKRMWVYSSDKIINLISISKDGITEFFKVCNNFDQFDINYWNLGNPPTGDFFDPDCQKCGTCQGQIVIEPPDPEST